MSLRGLLDPFAELTEPIRERLFQTRRREREAEARFQHLLATYRLLLQDARYQVVQEDVRAILGRELQQLVLRARTCETCGPRAERVRLLQEIVGEPLQAVWVDAHRPKLAVDEDA